MSATLTSEEQGRLLGAAVEGVAWALIYYETDIADRGVTAEHYRDAVKRARKILPTLIPDRTIGASNQRETTSCRECGGDGVVIDDDPESARAIVKTCPDCDGSGLVTDRAIRSEAMAEHEVCWGCKQIARFYPASVPMSVLAEIQGADIPLCGICWAWWVHRWVNSDKDPGCSSHLIQIPDRTNRSEETR
jgi:hypothetical protein